MYSSMLNLPNQLPSGVAALKGLRSQLHPVDKMGPAVDPELERLSVLQDEFEAHPGAGPGGTGDTGLLPNDAQGFSQLANRRAEYLALQKKKAGALAALQQMVG